MPPLALWPIMACVAVVVISGILLMARLDELRARQEPGWRPPFFDPFAVFRYYSYVLTNRHRAFNDRRVTTLVYVYRSALAALFLTIIVLTAIT